MADSCRARVILGISAALMSCLIAVTSFATVSKGEYEAALDWVEGYFPSVAPEANHLLVNPPNGGFDSYWEFYSVIRASYDRRVDTEGVTHIVYMYGGYPQAPFINKDVLYFVLCHELGHGLGGEPLKASLEGSFSVEGQADYYATSSGCLQKAFADRPLSDEEIEDTTMLSKEEREFCASLSAKSPAPAVKNRECKRTLDATKRFLTQDSHEWELTQKLKKLDPNMAFEEARSNPNFNPWKGRNLEEKLTKFDVLGVPVEEADEVNLEEKFYPSRECRAQTIINGYLGRGRPKCWFPAGAANGY